MNIRTRFESALRDRINEELPRYQVVRLRGSSRINTVVESLKFNSHCEDYQGWNAIVSLQGVFQVQFNVGISEKLSIEPLIISLLDKPVILQPQEDTEDDEFTSYLKTQIIEWKDTIDRSERIEIAVRFAVNGFLLKEKESDVNVTALFSQVPEIGVEYEDKYGN